MWEVDIIWSFHSYYSTLLSDLYNLSGSMALHRYVAEFRPLNLQVRLSVSCLEVPFEGVVSEEALALIFSVHYSKCARSIQRIIGDVVLSPHFKRILFPSQVVSVFYSNILDLLHLWSLLEDISS